MSRTSNPVRRRGRKSLKMGGVFHAMTFRATQFNRFLVLIEH